MLNRAAAPLEILLPVEKRDEIRAAVLSRAPRWYNPWLHLAVPSSFALAVVMLALSRLESLSGWQLLAVPIVYVITNANEWRIHRDMLHRRFLLAPVLYDRHTRNIT